VPIIAAADPGDCFYAIVEAVRIAIKYRTPVFMLSDGYLANGAEPWLVPDVDALPDLAPLVNFAEGPNQDGRFMPFLRDPYTLARPWAPPGRAGLEHRIGGLEKADVTGNISYDPDNHQRMTELRQAKVDGIAHDIPPLAIDPVSDEDADVLVIGWGSTAGPIRAAIRRVQARGLKVARAHLRHLNPLPTNTGEIVSRYERVLVPEMNMGQLSLLLRARYLVDAQGYNRVTGLPFTSRELEQAIVEQIEKV
jgi:2-oxoglutarate/2-oxoacid ferredoxin oxidoreductase subunit alpha